MWRFLQQPTTDYNQQHTTTPLSTDTLDIKVNFSRRDIWRFLRLLICLAIFTWVRRNVIHGSTLKSNCYNEMIQLLFIKRVLMLCYRNNFFSFVWAVTTTTTRLWWSCRCRVHEYDRCFGGIIATKLLTVRRLLLLLPT